MFQNSHHRTWLTNARTVTTSMARAAPSKTATYMPRRPSWIVGVVATKVAAKKLWVILSKQKRILPTLSVLVLAVAKVAAWIYVVAPWRLLQNIGDIAVASA